MAACIQRQALVGHVRPGGLGLVATDDAEVRHILCDELGDQGYRVITAGAAPVEELAAHLLPALIVLDLDRDALRGLAALTRIRERSGGAVIALSSQA